MTKAKIDYAKQDSECKLREARDVIVNHQKKKKNAKSSTKGLVWFLCLIAYQPSRVI